MEVVSIGLICMGGLIIFNNLTLTYNFLHPKPKVYKVREYTKQTDLNIQDEFDSKYNQLYKNIPEFILVEELETNVIKKSINQVVTNGKKHLESMSKKNSK